VAIDEAVLKALALQAPVAEDLREVLAVKMIATDLERVGDLARNIAKSARAAPRTRRCRSRPR
jgi:phosphate transport system protein